MTRNSAPVGSPFDRNPPGASPARADLAVCIIACDRPSYFHRTVRSLRRQARRDGAAVYCFLDGSVNMRSGAMRGLPWGIARCADIFGAAFPDGELHASPVNLGIALNFRRAERHVFLTRRHEYVLFLEDDFVLQPHYLQLVRAMIRQFGEHPRVGAFSAFGDNAASVASQRANRHRIKAMGHDWAFCVPRARWLERQPHYAAYLRYIRRVDYVLRSHDHIVHRLYPRLGARSDISSQDGAKTIAMLNAGQVKLSTYTNNGYYIGRMGTHFTPRIFARMGYRERERLVFEELEERLDWTTADLDGIEAQLRAAFLQ